MDARRILDPVLRAWRNGEPELYRAGSEGPRCQEHILEPGNSWRSLEFDPIPTHA